MNLRRIDNPPGYAHRKLYDINFPFSMLNKEAQDLLISCLKNSMLVEERRDGKWITISKYNDLRDYPGHIFRLSRENKVTNTKDLI